MTIPQRITEFISENDVMTIASSSQNQPYCAAVFYVYIPEKNLMCFMSDKTTRHIQEIILNDCVSGTILPKNVSIAKVKGLQFTGKIFEPEDSTKKECIFNYHKLYPMAILHPSTLWVIEPDFFKLTDYRLGFGKKLLWKKE